MQMAHLLYSIDGERPDEDVFIQTRLPLAVAAGAVRKERKLLAVRRPGWMGGAAPARPAIGDVADGVGRDNPFPGAILRRSGRRNAGQMQFGAAVRPVNRPCQVGDVRRDRSEEHTSEL